MNKDDVKMVIVMRDKYLTENGLVTPRKGKLIAQGAHAASSFLILKVESRKGWSAVEEEWLRTGTKKICVRVDTEEHLMEIHQKARTAGLTVHSIIDSGLTEFHGVSTRTCLAIGPDRASLIDKITGDLKLL